MTAYDYILDFLKGTVVYDEAGNAYIMNAHDVPSMERYVKWYCDSDYFISSEDCGRLKQYEITFEEDVKCMGIARRPYYRMRGKPVTPEQAFDIIRRTDNFFSSEIRAISEHEDFVGGYNFDNWLLQRNHGPHGYGWIHTDGTVGSNAITQKFPRVEEYVWEWLAKLLAFPYLDLVIAVTYWNELPSELWDKDYDECSSIMVSESFDKNFYDAVETGIYAHDKKIEILGKASAVKKYMEYDRLYGGDREKFQPEYYESRGIIQADLPYLKRCIESYGLDADAELSKVSEYIWKGDMRNA